jgi:hypothetical protein
MQAQIIANGGFEAGLAGWTTLDIVGSDGTFFVQSGAASPVNGLPVAPPPEGLQAAMTDAGGPGSHVLYQDFVVPVGASNGTVGFSLFINNTADRFASPATLDFAATNPQGVQNLNQQARVDILTTTADPFSIAAADVLQNLFQTNPGDPLVSGYNSYLIDVGALFQAHQGETLRLRFAETDNLAIFNFGVDRVSVVPEPSSLLTTGFLLLTGGALLGRLRSRRRS